MLEGFVKKLEKNRELAEDIDMEGGGGVEDRLIEIIKKIDRHEIKKNRGEREKMGRKREREKERILRPKSH